MTPVSYLDPKSREKILDLCAAPGGKSTQIASRMMARVYLSLIPVEYFMCMRI